MVPTITTTAPTSTTTTTATTATTLPALATGTTAASPVPIVIALLALFVALWSAFSSHRSRRAAERTAGLTEQRRQEEQAPSVEYVSANEAPEEGVRVVNETTVAYTSVRFTIVPSPDEPTPVEALQVEYNEPGVGWQPRWIQEGEPWDLGPLGPGESRLLDLRRPDQRGWPTTPRTHATAHPRLHDHRLSGVGHPHVRDPAPAANALRLLGLNLCATPPTPAVSTGVDSAGTLGVREEALRAGAGGCRPARS